MYQEFRLFEEVGSHLVIGFSFHFLQFVSFLSSFLFEINIGFIS